MSFAKLSILLRNVIEKLVICESNLFSSIDHQCHIQLTHLCRNGR